MYQLIQGWQSYQHHSKKYEFHTARRGPKFLRVLLPGVYVGGEIRPLPGETVPLRALERTELTCTATGPIDFERSDCRLRTVRRKTLQIPVAISGRTYEDNPKSTP
jgi:hypothetical protein